MKFRPRFTLRTVFVLVAIFAAVFGWIGWNLKIVNERKQLVMDIADQWGHDPNWNESQIGFVCRDNPEDITWIRHVLGDANFGALSLPADTPTEFIERAKKVFTVQQKP
jgi:hypothetical protein